MPSSTRRVRTRNGIKVVLERFADCHHCGVHSCHQYHCPKCKKSWQFYDVFPEDAQKKYCEMVEVEIAGQCLVVLMWIIKIKGRLERFRILHETKCPWCYHEFRRIQPSACWGLNDKVFFHRYAKGAKIR